MGGTIPYPTRQQEVEQLYTRFVNRQSTLPHPHSFYISKIKPYVENHSTNFPGRNEEQPDEVTEGRLEVERVLEFRNAPCTGKSQYLAR